MKKSHLPFLLSCFPILALAKPVPPQPEILRRFGNAQPTLPLPPFHDGHFKILPNETIVFTGQENMVRQQQSGELEARLALAFAEEKPVFRYMAWEADTVYQQWRELNFGDWKNQLETAGATTIIIQYGKMEALDGKKRLSEFIAAYHHLLDQFSAQTRRIVLLSPTPFEKPLAPLAPDLSGRNGDLAAYVTAIRDIAAQRKAIFIDLFTTAPQKRLTEDGLHPTPVGLGTVARMIAEQIGNMFRVFRHRFKLDQDLPERDRTQFRRPRTDPDQLTLFDEL